MNASIQEEAVTPPQAPHIAQRLALEAEVLAILAAEDKQEIFDQERAEGLLFDSG